MVAKFIPLQCIVNGEEKPPKLLMPLGIRHFIGETPSHGHRQYAQKFGKDRACGYGNILADRQTDRQTHTHRRAHHKTSQPLPRAK